MKVAINSLPLTTGHRVRGIGFYTKHLVESLKKRNDIIVQEFSESAEVKEADIIHFPFFDLFQRTLPLFKYAPTVVTVHDVIPLIFPEHYPPGMWGKLNNLYQKISLKNVSAVITDSRSSKQDIVRFLNIPEKMVTTIPLAVPDYFRPQKDLVKLKAVKEKYGLPDKFLLFIGSVNWNKNILGLAEACIKTEVDLVLVGKDFEDKNNLFHSERRSYQLFLQRYSQNPYIHVVGFIPEEDLVSLINLAQIVLLPSFYEGFGLPILESQACGTPVITGNISSMPEVAGDGAMLVDPYKTEKIVEVIEKILQDKSQRDLLIEKGLQNVRKFSWEKVADETIKVYQTIAG